MPNSKLQHVILTMHHLRCAVAGATHQGHRLTLSANLRTTTTTTKFTVSPPIKPWPKTLTPTRLISLINRTQNLDLALQIFHHAGHFHTNFFHTFPTYLYLVSRLARARLFSQVETLMTQLKNDPRVQCSEIIFVVMIRNYGLAGRYGDALRWFGKTGEFGVKRTGRLLNCVLNALVQCRRYDLTGELFRVCGERFGVESNLGSCNVVLKGLCRKGDMKGARKVIDEMPRMGLVPNGVSYTTVMGGYVGVGDVEGARWAFGEILDRGWKPDVMTYTVLMDGYCRSGRFVDAVRVMDEMEENRVRPNEVTYGVMIEAYCKEKRHGEAMSLLGDMIERRYVPSSVLCCKVIDVLCEVGKVEGAYALWRRLLRKNVTPDNAISSTLIHWLCKAGKVSEAKKLFDEFDRSWIPSVLTYNTLIAGLCDHGQLCEAGRLWDDMVEKRCFPNAFTYNMLIKGFCKAGKPEEGVRVLKEMIQKRCPPNESTYSKLFEGFCDSGSLEQIMELLILATSNGIRVDANSWRLILSKAIGNVETGAILDNRTLEDSVT